MISVVICSKDPAKSQAIRQHYATLLAHHDHETIIIPDARSLCEGYHRGFTQSRGEYLIFSHDDVEILAPDFARRLLEHLAHFDGVGVAGSDKLVGPSWYMVGPPHLFGQVAHTVQGAMIVSVYGPENKGGIQVLDGLFMAFRRTVVEKIGWDFHTFTDFHHYDLDFSFRAYQAGFKLAVVTDLPVFHGSGGLNNAEWKTSAKAFLQKHHLPAIPLRKFQLSVIWVTSKAEALEVLEGVARAGKLAPLS